MRNIVIRRDYRPGLPGGDPEGGTTVDLATTELTAEELLDRLCAVAYRSTGSYVAAAKRLGLDRRTVKSRAEAYEKRTGD